jgi:hypothetical protein
MVEGRKHHFDSQTGGKFYVSCSGASGIGKSLFMVYVVYRVIQEIQTNPECKIKEIYVRDQATKERYLQLWPYQQYVDRDDLRDNKKALERLLLIDGWIDDDTQFVDAHLLLFCSDRKINYNKIFKKYMLKTIMPPWTFEEIETLCDVLDMDPAKRNVVSERFKLYGGAPRNLLDEAVNFDALINDFKLENVKSFSAQPETSDRVTFRLVHLFPIRREADYVDGVRIGFASSIIAERLTQRLLMEESDFIVRCLVDGEHTSEKVIYDAWEVISWRIFKHKLQENPQYVTFEQGICWSQSNDQWQTANVSLPHWGPENVKRVSYNSVDRVGEELRHYLRDRCVLSPSYSNQETVDGAMYVPSPKNVIFFQFTLAESHSLNLRGLLRFIQALRGIVTFPEKIVFVLVLPPSRGRCRVETPTFSGTQTRQEAEILRKLVVFVAHVSEDGVKHARTLRGW